MGEVYLARELKLERRWLLLRRFWPKTPSRTRYKRISEQLEFPEAI